MVRGTWLPPELFPALAPNSKSRGSREGPCCCWWGKRAGATHPSFVTPRHGALPLVLALRSFPRGLRRMDVFPPAALCFHLAPPSLSAGAGGGWRRLGSGSLPGTPLAPERLGSLPRCTPSPFQLHLWRAASPHGIIRDARDLHRPSLFHLRISCLTLRRFDFYSKFTFTY